MNSSKVLLVLFFFLGGCNASNEVFLAAVRTSENTPVISENNLKKYLEEFSSASFQGRGTGTKGDSLAIHYLKDIYAESNVDCYFQNVPLVKRYFNTVQLKINGTSFIDRKDFVVSSSTLNGKHTFNDIIDGALMKENSELNLRFNHSIVYISPEKGTSEVARNVRNKKIAAKIAMAKLKGASGAMVSNADDFDNIKRVFEWEKNKFQKGKTTILNGNPFFVIYVNETIAEILDQTKNVKKEKLSLKIDFKQNSQPLKTTNVISIVKGREKPDEYILLSAHLDHLGKEDEGAKVYHGADDNASGTVSLLEISKAFKAAANNNNGPKRSVIFAHFAAEELGLLGSEYYVDNPSFPLDKTLVNLNVDMIGRTGYGNDKNRNYIYMLGSPGLSDELFEISEKVNRDCCNMELDYKYRDESNFFLSDHYYFGKKEIPYLFYFDGLHEDYHKITDTADKIDYPLLTQRTNLIFQTAWTLANQ